MNLLQSKFIFWLCTTAGLIIAVVLGTMTSYGDYKQLVIITGGVVALIFLCLPMNWLWLITVGSTFLTGDLVFLPIPLKPYEILAIITCTRFLLQDLIFQKRPISLGQTPEALLLFGFVALFVVHAAMDRMGLKVLGSSIWGGRAYITITLFLIMYIALQSQRIDSAMLRALPSVVLAFGFAQFSIGVVTALVPPIAYVLSVFYSGVYMANSEFAARLGFVGNFGYVLILWAASRSRIQDFLLRARIVPAIAFGLGIAACLISGYRSTILVAAVMCMLVCYRDFRMKMILPFCLLGVGLMGLVWFHSSVERLPRIIQRGLVVLPGDWDRDVVLDAEASNEFRFSLWEYWSNYYFWKHPMIGRGLGFPAQEALALGPTMGLDSFGGTSSSFQDQDEYFALTGSLHNGFLSILDRFGVLGTLLLVGWFACFCFMCWKYMMRPGKLDPPIQWVTIYSLTYTACYFPGALRIEDFITLQLLYIGVLYSAISAEKLQKARANIESQSILPTSEAVPLKR